MAGWHHRLDGCESEWTPGDGDGQGGLACCDSWGRKIGHDWVTELNWTECKNKWILRVIQSFGKKYKLLLYSDDGGPVSVPEIVVAEQPLSTLDNFQIGMLNVPFIVL